MARGPEAGKDCRRTEGFLVAPISPSSLPIPVDDRRRSVLFNGASSPSSFVTSDISNIFPSSIRKCSRPTSNESISFLCNCSGGMTNGAKYFSLIAGTAANRAMVSYCMNPVTKSHAVSAQQRLESSSPPQNVLMNHFRSHRGGNPLRTAGSGEHALCHN